MPCSSSPVACGCAILLPRSSTTAFDHAARPCAATRNGRPHLFNPLIVLGGSRISQRTGGRGGDGGHGTRSSRRHGGTEVEGRPRAERGRARGEIAKRKHLWSSGACVFRSRLALVPPACGRR